MPNDEMPDVAQIAEEAADAAEQTFPEVEPIDPPETPDAPDASDAPQDNAIAGLSDDDDALTALRNMEAKRKARKRNRIIKIAIAAVIAVAALVLFLMRDTLFPPATPEVEPETMTVARSEFRTTVQGSGSLKPGSTAVVTPEVSGIIESVLVEEGQYVEEGDVVVTLRNADLDKTVSEAADSVSKASTDVYNAQVEVNDLQASYENAVDQYNWSVAQNEIDTSNAKVAGDEAYSATYDAEVAKIPKDATPEEREQLIAAAKEKAQQAYQTAYDAVPITPIAEYDDASYVSQIDSAWSSVTSAQSTLGEAQRVYDTAVEQADKRNVKAPASGTVLALSAVPGAAVGGAEGGTSTNSGALMQISDMSKLKVSIQVNEIDIMSIKEGQKAVVTFSALPELELSATVASVASVATGSGDESGMGGGGGGGIATFTVALNIDQVDERLKPGMTATVNIITQDEKDVIVVPTSALNEVGETAYVQVVVGDDPNTTEQREVKVGARSSSQAVIESGLKEGETIAYGGSNALSDLVGGDEGGVGVAVSAG